MKIAFGPSSISLYVPTYCGTEMFLIEEQLPGYFEIKQYGKGCKIIRMIMHCVHPGFADLYVDEARFDEGKKTLFISTEMNYELLQNMTTRIEFANHICERLLNQFRKTNEIGIRDFDVPHLINDFEEFSKNYLANHPSPQEELRQPYDNADSLPPFGVNPFGD